MIAAARSGPLHGRRWRRVWHDTPAGDLAREGLALSGGRTGWALRALHPAPPWMPGLPVPVLARAADPAGLGRALPELLGPAGSAEALERRLELIHDGAALTLTTLTGHWQVGAVSRPFGRIGLTGPAPAVAAFAHALAEILLPVNVPVLPLAAEMAGSGDAPPAPRLHERMSVAEGSAHVIAGLATILLTHLAAIGAGAQGEQVHQARVTLRRLRAALAAFRPALAGPEAKTAKAALKALGRRLGPPRDWDVFAGGTARRLHDIFPEERGVARLLARAGRRQTAGYAALRDWLAAPEGRCLGIDLALLLAIRPPSDAEAEQTALLAVPVEAFGRQRLARQWRRLLAQGEDVSALPAETLHKVRLHGKRLRYTAELFSPLFPGKAARRFLRRLGRLQEVLGEMNDAIVAGRLVAELRGPPGVAEAAGLARGLLAGSDDAGRARIATAWRKLRRAEPFWE